MQTVRTEASDVVTTIIIDRPERRNAVDGPTAEALARTIARFPQRCMLSDRQSCYEGFGLSLEAALANEFRLGQATVDSGETVEGVRHFQAGEGRHGRF